jgi:hypothetical protein
LETPAGAAAKGDLAHVRALGQAGSGGDTLQFLLLAGGDGGKPRSRDGGEPTHDCKVCPMDRPSCELICVTQNYPCKGLARNGGSSAPARPWGARKESGHEIQRNLIVPLVPYNHLMWRAQANFSRLRILRPPRYFRFSYRHLIHFTLFTSDLIACRLNKSSSYTINLYQHVHMDLKHVDKVNCNASEDRLH